MKKSCKVIYASQTGTSEDLAFDLEEWLSQSQSVSVECMNIKDYKAPNLAMEKSLIIFLISTCGQGEVPEDMRVFWRFLLQKRLPKNSIPNLRYCIIGLGDQSYPLFNYAAKKLEARLQFLGAVSVIDCWLCDEDSLGKDYLSWQTRAKILFEIESKALEVLPKKLRYQNVRYAESESGRNGEMGQWCDVVKREYVNKHTTKVVLNVATVEGDILHLFPSNIQGSQFPPSRIKGRIDKNESLESLIQVWGLQGDLDKVVLCDNREWSGLSLHNILSTVLDVYGRITSVSLRIAAYFSEYESDQKETITEMAQNNWSQMSRDFIYLRNVTKLFQEFKTNVAKIPLALLLNCFKELQSRAYSVALCCNNQSTLIVSNHQKADALGRVYFGRCTTSLYWNEIQRFRYFVKKGSLNKTMFDAKKNVLMIVVGTGLASVLSFIKARCPPFVSEWILFQGCRYEGLEQEKIEEFVKQGALSEYHLALSQPNKVYAWHLLLQHGKKVYEKFLSKSDSLIVIGGSVSNGFARDVNGVFCTIFKENDSAVKTNEDAQALVRKMEVENRIIFDVYG